VLLKKGNSKTAFLIVFSIVVIAITVAGIIQGEREKNFPVFVENIVEEQVEQEVFMNFVSSTEYYFGDVGEVASELMDYKNNWINASCFATAYYPNKTTFYEEKAMLVNPDSEVYYHKFIVPNLSGVYEYKASCYFSLIESDVLYHIEEDVPPTICSDTTWPTINITTTSVVFVEYITFFQNGGYPDWTFRNLDENITISNGTLVFDYDYPFGISNRYSKAVLNQVFAPGVNYQLIVTPEAGVFGCRLQVNGTTDNPYGLIVVQDNVNAFDIVGGIRGITRSKSFHVSNSTTTIINEINDQGLRAVIAR